MNVVWTELSTEGQRFAAWGALIFSVALFVFAWVRLITYAGGRLALYHTIRTEAIGYVETDRGRYWVIRRPFDPMADMLTVHRITANPRNDTAGYTMLAPWCNDADALRLAGEVIPR